MKRLSGIFGRLLAFVLLAAWLGCIGWFFKWWLQPVMAHLLPIFRDGIYFLFVIAFLLVIFVVAKNLN
jgi:hypothetical protein